MALSLSITLSKYNLKLLLLVSCFIVPNEGVSLSVIVVKDTLYISLNLVESVEKLSKTTV